MCLSCRGTTRLSFAVDKTPLDSSAYNLKKVGAAGAAGERANGGRRLAEEDEMVFELSFAGEGSLGLSCGHTGQWAERIVLKAAPPKVQSAARAVLAVAEVFA